MSLCVCKQCGVTVALCGSRSCGCVVCGCVLVWVGVWVSVSAFTIA